MVTEVYSFTVKKIAILQAYELAFISKMILSFDRSDRRRITHFLSKKRKLSNKSKLTRNN